VELNAIILKIFSAMTSEQVLAKLEEAQIANASLNDMHQFWDHPQLRARERWHSVESPNGLIPALLPPGINTAYEYSLLAPYRNIYRCYCKKHANH